MAVEGFTHYAMNELRLTRTIVVSLRQAELLSCASSSSKMIPLPLVAPLMLETSDTVVDHTDTGEEALELTRHYEYDIVLLDIMLPDIEGYEVVRRIRLARSNTPVLILSGLSGPQAKVKGLGMGADDYITKPFDRAELLARIRAITRHSKRFGQPVLRVGPLELNLDTRKVTIHGRGVHLIGREYALLEFLVIPKGVVLSKEVFFNHLYGGIDEPELKHPLILPAT